MEVSNSDSLDWVCVFNGPALPIILSHLDKKSIFRLRRTCRVLGGMDSLKAKCFECLRLTISHRPGNNNRSCSYQIKGTFISLDDQDSFGALGRLAPFVKAMNVFNAHSQRMPSNEELALLAPLPRFPNVSVLEWDWKCQEYGEYPNPETLLAFARLTPAVSRVILKPDWALIPGPFHAQLLSLWPQLTDVRVHGDLSERLSDLQTDRQTLLKAASFQGILTELELYLRHRPAFDLPALICNNQTSLRVLDLWICGFSIVSSYDFTALFRLNALEKLGLRCIRDRSGNGIVSREFLMALASVTTLKELSLTSQEVWSCTAMDLVQFFLDAQFSLRVLRLYALPFTAALPPAIAQTQRDLEEVRLILRAGAETVDKSVLVELPKIKEVDIHD